MANITPTVQKLLAVFRDTIAAEPDPYARLYGCTDLDEAARYRQAQRETTEILAAAGVTPAELEKELRDRVSPKWLWNSGLLHLLDPDDRA